MKICKSLSLFFLALLTFNCSSDDDNGNDNNGQTTLELLTSGKWYNESVSPGSYTDCEKMGYIQFLDNDSITIESFEENAGNCDSLGINTATFTLTNDLIISISFEGDIITAEIVSITQNSLTITTDEETVTFDKTEG